MNCIRMNGCHERQHQHQQQRKSFITMPYGKWKSERNSNRARGNAKKSAFPCFVSQFNLFSKSTLKIVCSWLCIFVRIVLSGLYTILHIGLPFTACCLFFYLCAQLCFAVVALIILKQKTLKLFSNILVIKVFK